MGLQLASNKLSLASLQLDKWTVWMRFSCNFQLFGVIQDNFVFFTLWTLLKHASDIFVSIYTFFVLS